MFLLFSPSLGGESSKKLVTHQNQRRLLKSLNLLGHVLVALPVATCERALTSPTIANRK